jgi:phage tail sheath protein FI
MAELLTPGVFIQEVDFGPQPIEGVSTSTAGFVGETERGPSDGDPILVTSFPDFQRRFGGFVEGMVLPRAVRGFFDNGGRRAFIARVVGPTATEATGVLNDGYDVPLLSSASSAAALAIFTISVGSVVGVTHGDTIEIIDRVGNAVHTLTVQNGGVNALANTLTVQTSTAMQALNPAKHAVRYAEPDVAPSARVNFEALYKGAYGNRIQVRLVPIYLGSTTIVAVNVANTVFTLASVDGIFAGQRLEFDHVANNGKAYATVDSVNPAAKTITFLAAVVPPAPDAAFVADDVVRITGWRLEVTFDGALVETIGAISSTIDNTKPDFENGILQRINATSAWVRVTGTPSAVPGLATTTTSTYAFSLAGQPTFFTQGTGVDDAADSTDVVGNDTPPRSGLRAIEAQKDINIIAAPGFATVTVVGELIAQAERTFDRFAIFETDNDPAEVTTVLQQRAQYNSRFAAMYHPWLTVLDSLTGTTIKVPPAGHVAGAYARTDNERGVFKAPANVVLRGITGFTRNVPDGEQDLLNPNGVNVLRRFDGLGDVIWGARTISSEGLWKYVPVRRLFIFLEQSIVKGTRFAVFEPNDPRLWARIRDAVTNFLTSQWRAGALFGAKAEEAFFVKVDETTTTQDDRDNGRVNIIVGIAPVKPAEFIVFQIGQAPQSVIIAEQS